MTIKCAKNKEGQMSHLSEAKFISENKANGISSASMKHLLYSLKDRKGKGQCAGARVVILNRGQRLK